MSLLFEERLSDSPYIETVTHGRTTGLGSAVRPAECHWHMVIVRHSAGTQLLVVGPLTESGTAAWGEGAEIVWIRFKLGVYMPHLMPRQSLNVETPLPGAAARSFWLQGAAWQFPDHENADTFVDRLARQESLVLDPVVSAVLQGYSQGFSPRTVRDRFLRTTGLARNHIRQVERAKQAAALLGQGGSILDAVHTFGYFDQPHLTRALKRWVGHTPAQLLRLNETVPQSQNNELISNKVR